MLQKERPYYMGQIKIFYNELILIFIRNKNNKLENRRHIERFLLTPAEGLQP